MAHHRHGNSYSKLVERLNRSPQGAPPSETLYKILKILFSKKDAQRVALLPIKPFNASKAAGIWKTDLLSAIKILDELAGKAILVDMEINGEIKYVLPPPMAGFIEFSLMRTRNDIDQKLLSELYFKYINIEEDFSKELFLTGDTQLGRVFVQEQVVPDKHTLNVLDYERATEVIKTASHIGISMCYCRHKKMHLNMACDAPMDICMTFNTTAASLIKHGHVRKVDKAECLDLLETAYENKLVQFGENNRNRVNFICNCCPCCCEAMVVARKFGFSRPVHTTNFIAGFDACKCNACGKCTKVCPVEAFQIDRTIKKEHRTAKFTSDLCLGCGVCVRECPTNALSLMPREKRVITPCNSAHRTVVMAIERGKLQNLIFDNRVMWSHRMLGTLLGVILKLPGIKQAMASEQIKSRYLETVLNKITF